jgi:predicted O-methyltransferase YrrM
VVEKTPPSEREPDPLSGLPAVDAYLEDAFESVPGMSYRFAAAICCGAMRLQAELGVAGPIVEIGTFEGRFFIALAKALQPGEVALGIDHFEWPDPKVIERFEANCAVHGIAADRRLTWNASTRDLTPADVLARLGGAAPRLVHIDGEHTRAALTADLELAAAVMHPAGLLVLDDMLHPGYPTLVVAVHKFLVRHPELTVLCIIDRETVVAAAKFVLCRRDWVAAYEQRLLATYRAWVWPLGAQLEPDWRLVLSRDTFVPEIAPQS